MKSETTIKIVSIAVQSVDQLKLTTNSDSNKITGVKIGGENKNKTIDINMNRDIYLALLVEMKKANITIDEDLNCFTNRIFTIFEREWKDVPVFGAELRKDLEKTVLSNI